MPARAILTFTLAMSVTAASPQLATGDRLSPLTGDLLTGRRITLPDEAAGRVTVLLLGFTYASRFPVEAYGNWLRTAFADDARVTSYEIPVIGGMARLGRWFIDSGMRRGTPANLHDRVITVYGDSRTWKSRFGVTDTNDRDAFVVVLDRAGTIRWMAHGSFSDSSARELDAAILQVLE